MNEDNREIVNRYLKHVPTSDLQFQELFLEGNPVGAGLDELPLDDLVEKCLNLTFFYSSVSDDLGEECYNGRDRSVLDIWRHVKFFSPDTTIFEVMNSIHKLSKTKRLVGQHCNDTGRQMFNLKTNQPRYSLFVEDETEFGFDFYEWEGI